MVNSRYKVQMKGNQWLVGECKKRHSSRSKRSRTLLTYQRKVARLKKFYNNHPKLKSKYPTFEEWFSKIPIKQVIKHETKGKVTTSSSKSFTFGGFR